MVFSKNFKLENNQINPNVNSFCVIYITSVSVLAWFDGAAIYLAVLIVSGFSSIVDYQKEKKFVERSQVEEDENNVSEIFFGRALRLFDDLERYQMRILTNLWLLFKFRLP